MRSSRYSTVLAVALVAAAGCRPTRVEPCTALQSSPAVATSAPIGDSVTLRIDYEGAEAMIAALERKSLSDAAIDSLLTVHGVRATIDNVTRYFPELGDAEFRRALQRFRRDGRIATEHWPFTLRRARSERSRIRSLVETIRTDEAALLRGTLATIAPYRPDTGPLHLTAYLVAGGTSTGFVPESPGVAAFYANLADAEGDCDAVVLNVVHETYHLMQKAALRRAGLTALADSVEGLRVTERTLLTVLLEGTADLVADPARYAGTGPAMTRQRERYAADADPARVRENFAIFDTLFQQAARGDVSWPEIRDRGFMSDARFYALGRSMAQVIARDCGAPCIGPLFAQHPRAFFLEYIRLYRADPQVVGRFAPETEMLLGTGG